MKRGLFLIILLISSVHLSAQLIFDKSIGMGVSYFNTDTKSSSNIGLHMEIAVSNFYVDCAFNNTQLNGEYMNSTRYPFLTTDIYYINVDLVKVGLVNAGYIVHIDKRFSLTPLVGFGWKNYITSMRHPWSGNRIITPIAYYDNVIKYLNLGIITNIRLNRHISTHFGVGLFETFKCSLSYDFN